MENRGPDENREPQDVRREPDGPGFAGFIEKSMRLMEYVAVAVFAICFLMIVMTPHGGVSNDAKKTKAKQDCDTLVQAILRYATLEGTDATSESMIELKGKYVTNIHMLKDPWGESYCNDAAGKFVYSKGPDRAHDPADPLAAVNADDVTISYLVRPSIIAAKLEVNPLFGKFNGEAEIHKCFDRLHLYFSLPLHALPLSVPLHSVSMSREESESEDPGAGEDSIFRYYVSSDRTASPVAPPSDLAKACGEGARVEWGGDSREIVITFKPGFTVAHPSKDLLVPGKHYINITGAKNRRNFLFFCVDPLSGKVAGMVAAKSHVLIQNY